MGDKVVELDRSQVKKAVQALQAFLKTKSSKKKLFTDDFHKINVLFTLWKVPGEAQTIRIPLPHSTRTDSENICLFTRDEPKMTTDQTVRFYKKLLEERGVKNVSEIIPYKVLKTEYKPFEAKLRLLGNFNMFFADSRIRRRLPSHLGKHFYEKKREPLAVNLLSKQLARDIQKMFMGTTVKVNNNGPCCMARVGHSAMTADELTENIEAAVQTMAEKIRMKGPVLKIIHLKSEKSVALPIYNSNPSQLPKLDATEAESAAEGNLQDTKQTPGKEAKKRKVEEGDEEIPQLVPIEAENKKPKRKQKKIRPADKKHASKQLKMKTGRAMKPKRKSKMR
ncbi:ribosomal L1 domain-containing protein 1 [Syngnathus acus]|uniref:ribosomal L1 domain-containing protein 1 n=1 Tax=Syngnathus acus TaxID=161584 RepID=UPI00188600A6|nr:ribosomal L1 domain-containing protein 1 [Syngnathus acus]